MLKVAILVSGGGTNLQAIIDAKESGKIKNCEIKTVISSRKDAYAIERAKKHGIESKVLRPRDFESKESFDQALLDYLEPLEIDLIVLAGYLVILSPKLIDTYPNRIINIHPSLIPAFCGDGYYGLKVHEAAIERGVKITGATVHIVDHLTDHGPILFQKAVEVKEEDTPKILQERVMKEAEWEILPLAIATFDQWQSKYQGINMEIGKEST